MAIGTIFNLTKYIFEKLNHAELHKNMYHTKSNLSSGLIKEDINYI